jgi:hypothetical protein
MPDSDKSEEVEEAAEEAEEEEAARVEAGRKVPAVADARGMRAGAREI